MSMTRSSFYQRLITIIALGVFVYSLYHLVPSLYDYYKNDKTLKGVQQIYETTLDVKGDNENGESVRSSFLPLQEINTDIVGWITTDQTKIHYPILQAEDNEFYLTRNYQKEETRAGSIFLDYRNDTNLENNWNTIIYGHRMKDGSMFGQLKKYLEKDFFNENSTIYLDSLYEGYDVEVFSVYQTTTDFYYIETEFSDGPDYQQFIQQLQERSLYEADVEIGPDDQIVTLSTCDYAVDSLEGRLVVHGKLVKRGEAG